MEIIDYSTLHGLSLFLPFIMTIALIVFTYYAHGLPYAWAIIALYWALFTYAYVNMFVFSTVYVEISEEGLVIIKGLLREKEIYIPKTSIKRVYTTFSYIPIFLLGGTIGRTQILVEVETDKNPKSFTTWSKDYYIFCKAVQEYIGLTCTHEERIVKFKLIA